MAPGLENVAVEKNENIEIALCKKNDLVKGEMREICLDRHDLKVLLVRHDDGSYSAFGNKCPHYGAPLADGIMRNGRIRCSRHGACFNSKTGDIEDFPGLDSLPKHNVSIKEDKVMIHTTKKNLELEKRTKELKITPEKDSHIVIIGGGASALTCSEALRQGGYNGRIIVINKGRLLPYDRPIMTKDLNAKLDDLFMRKKEFYEEYAIEMHMGLEVVDVNTIDKKVICSEGQTFVYDQLLIATGLSVRRLNVPGGDLKNVFTVGSPSEANMIACKARGKKVVIIGGSFIGMEVVCFLTAIAGDVVVCCKNSAPFEHSFGKEVGIGLQKFHEERGVRFFTNNPIVSVGGTEYVESIQLKDGTVLEADIVVAGVGTSLTTSFLAKSGIYMDGSGYIIVDKYLQTNTKDVYASGAAVRFPLRYYQNKLVNIEHWQMAHYHGRIAGLNMLTSYEFYQNKSEVNSVPFFFTEQYGIEIQYSGYGDEHDDVIVKGDVSQGKFCALYIKQDEVVAVAAMRYGNIAARVAEMLLARESIPRASIDKLIGKSMAM